MVKTNDVLHNGHTRGSKIVYDGIRRYLPRHHLYWRNIRFNEQFEDHSLLKIISKQDVVRYAAWLQSYLDLGGRENGPNDLVHVTRVNRLSALYKLNYWHVRHLRLCMVCGFLYMMNIRVDISSY